ncbi:MAG: DEAD/DEAH box helicase [Holosporaceae bacterium]|nr:MAG: DEAD/DEAH box helicase [Holosporaceae bacterium]
MMQVIEQGAQAALLAPTEILAEQHGARFEAFLKDLLVRWAVITGKTPAKEKKSIKEKLHQGELDFVVGTHALLESTVSFKKLGYVVIDEQHRFGVNQRKKLIEKGDGVNLLVMSATPIPRSLALTAFGDLDICQLKEKPKGRLPIQTTLLSLARVETLYDHLQKALQKGQKFYWVCPLIEESETLDLGHAEARAAALKNFLGDKVGLLHGRLSSSEKEEVMAGFVAGTYQVLVSTTVIEVGVDVPDATVMIIEHAERFGLAQLDQLRGRVGRGAHPSSCVLLYGNKLSKVGKNALK